MTTKKKETKIATKKTVTKKKAAPKKKALKKQEQPLPGFLEVNNPTSNQKRTLPYDKFIELTESVLSDPIDGKKYHCNASFIGQPRRVAVDFKFKTKAEKDDWVKAFLTETARVSLSREQALREEANRTNGAN